MRDPNRILAKLLPPGADLEPFLATGEPLEVLVGLLRDVVKLRKASAWLSDAGLDVVVSPDKFYRLLDIPAINIIETPNRDLDVEVVSLKDTRHPEDPVAIGHFNAVLRELYRTLSGISESLKGDSLLLGRDISAASVEPAGALLAQLKSMNGQLTGYLFTGGRARKVEREFLTLFPGAEGLAPLRKRVEAVERELAFYRHCLKSCEKWSPIGLDVFRLLREETLLQARDNIEEMGNLLWNLVYGSAGVRESLRLAGIGFDDIGPLFDEKKAPLSAF